MKYIRTKNGRIIGLEPYNKDLDLIKYLSQFANYQGEYAPIKQADVIEELCDEFVAEGIPFRDFVIDLNEIKKQGLDIHSFSRLCYVQYRNCCIYGAIYVKGKGLVYVAKMNDKGELELL